MDMVEWGGGWGLVTIILAVLCKSLSQSRTGGVYVYVLITHPIMIHNFFVAVIFIYKFSKITSGDREVKCHKSSCYKNTKLLQYHVPPKVHFLPYSLNI